MATSAPVQWHKQHLTFFNDEVQSHCKTSHHNLDTGSQYDGVVRIYEIRTNGPTASPILRGHPLSMSHRYGDGLVLSFVRPTLHRPAEAGLTAYAVKSTAQNPTDGKVSERKNRYGQTEEEVEILTLENRAHGLKLKKKNKW